jgi:hypothetical protein
MVKAASREGHDGGDFGGGDGSVGDSGGGAEGGEGGEGGGGNGGGGGVGGGLGGGGLGAGGCAETPHPLSLRHACDVTGVNPAPVHIDDETLTVPDALFTTHQGVLVCVPVPHGVLHSPQAP